MKPADVFRTLAGGTVLYFVMAACSGSGSGGGGSSGGPGGGPGGGGGGSPVPDAWAAPPQQVAVRCDKEAGGWVYAEASLPGRSAADLARSIPLLKYDASKVVVPGYDRSVLYSAAFGAPSIFVKDGGVVVLCGIPTKDSSPRGMEITLLVPG